MGKIEQIGARKKTRTEQVAARKKRRHDRGRAALQRRVSIRNDSGFSPRKLCCRCERVRPLGLKPAIVVARLRGDKSPLFHGCAGLSSDIESLLICACGSTASNRPCKAVV